VLKSFSKGGAERKKSQKCCCWFSSKIQRFLTKPFEEKVTSNGALTYFTNRARNVTENVKEIA
jgi:hypothetical protein